ncbi:outer membrane beta-barrel protein [Rickettsia endosymbiont of Halotydeus destructor]|uniref:outer membrane beta-barrel protein n=1 Tax=Rickettsia endosymbiont of Halotydeus destructor TaxID=2996754 RepID=UPI003BAE9819
MKKLLLIAAASATILSSTLSSADMMNDNQWYLKVNAGATIFDKAKDGFTGLKIKSNTVFVGEIGAGYYVMDNVRTDVTLGTLASAQLKKSGVISAGAYAGSTGSVKHKPTIISLLLNGYVDFVDVGMFKAFGGAGVGLASVKDKMTWTINNAAISTTSKQTYNFAWQVSLGASAEVAEGVKAELTYSYRDYGKSKSKNFQVSNQNFQTGSTRFKGNNVMAGVRFDI